MKAHWTKRVLKYGRSINGQWRYMVRVHRAGQHSLSSSTEPDFSINGTMRVVDEWLLENFPECYAGFITSLMHKGITAWHKQGYMDFSEEMEPGYEEAMEARMNKARAKQEERLEKDAWKWEMIAEARRGGRDEAEDIEALKDVVQQSGRLYHGGKRIL